MSFLVAMLRLLAIVLWVGGLCFFAFAVAPVAFSQLPDAHTAGLVVGGTLRVLHWLGLCCAAVFVLATLTQGALSRAQRGGRVVAELVLVASMSALTLYSQIGILPRMDRARAANGGSVERNSAGPAAQEVQSLHHRSERVEGTVLLAGLGVCALLAFQTSSTAPRP